MLMKSMAAEAGLNCCSEIMLIYRDFCYCTEAARDARASIIAADGIYFVLKWV